MADLKKLNPAQALGRLIQEKRKGNGLSQQQVGEKLGLTRAAYASFEIGRIVPSLDHLIGIANIIGIDVGVLIVTGQPAKSNSVQAQILV